MKKLLYQLMAIGLLSAFCLSLFAQSPAKRLKAKPKGSTSLPYGYYEYLPSNYHSKSKLPVVIFFHGISEKGNGTSDLRKVLRVGPTKLVSQGKDFPFILISPQIKGGWWGTVGIQTLINYVKRTYKADPDRIYITGLSAGGFGTWLAGETLTNQVAAIVPICGCGDNRRAAKMKNLPVWAFHNSGDPTINIKCSTKMIDAIKSAGGKPKLTIYKSYSHNAWSKAYSDQNMWNWLLSQRRGKAPASEKIYKNPVVNAGSDRTLVLPKNTLSITANASDSDGKISSYSWKKISGPSAKMYNINKRNLKLSSLKKGTYVFRVTVKDNTNRSDYDDVKVVVNAKKSTNTPKPKNIAPTVNAGPDKVVTLPLKSLTLEAKCSDKDGKVIYTLWRKISGPSVKMNRYNQRKMYLTNLVAGTYVFRITVMDNIMGKNRGKASDIVKVTVKEGGQFLDVVEKSKNIAPTVYAGPDKVVTLPQKSVTLEAKCDDRDGKVNYTLWWKISGPSVKMNRYNQRKMYLTNLVPGTYVFRITVMDDEKGSDRGKAVDYVKLIVRKSNSSARLGITEAEVPEIKMFPNPTTDKFYLNLNAQEDSNAKIIILNNEGGIVQEREAIIRAGESPEINMSNYPAGVYFVRVVTGEKQTTLRMVKK